MDELASAERQFEDSTKRRRFGVIVFLGCGVAVQYWVRSAATVAVRRAARRYDWSGWMMPVALSAFFVGYLVGQVPAALMAYRTSARTTLGLSVLATALLNLALVPCLASAKLVIVLRVLCGLAQAATFPSLYSLASEWAGSSETSRAIGTAKALGESGGALIGLAGSMLLIDVRLTLPGGAHVGGLSLIFFVPAAFGLLWAVLLFACVPPHAPAPLRKAPDAAPPQSPALQVEGRALPRPLPSAAVWRALLCDTDCRVLYANHFAVSCFNYLLLTQLPEFCEAGLGLSGAFAAAVVASPYVTFFFALIAAGRAADAAISRRSGGDGETAAAARATVRTRIQVTGLVGSSAAMVLCGGGAARMAAPAAVPAAVALLNVAALFLATTGVGFGAVYLDLTKDAAGLLYAVSNVFATLAGVAVPQWTHIILAAAGPRYGWTFAFATSGYIGCGAATLWRRPAPGNDGRQTRSREWHHKGSIHARGKTRHAKDGGQRRNTATSGSGPVSPSRSSARRASTPARPSRPRTSPGRSSSTEAGNSKTA
ncbi:major facilitator superfamily domain-containing protein [Pelagophyceae sp. CCMP2097]|nr:major facilitator superfamily domain-containing protein [Pelagophyceae sp. CCMP2097]